MPVTPNPAVERDADQAGALRPHRLARRPSLLRWRSAFRSFDRRLWAAEN